MKKYINTLFLIGSLLFMVASCENDAELTRLASISFPSEIELANEALVLNETNSNEVVQLVSWPAVAFTIKAPVTYTLQFDLIGNTGGSDAWKNAIRVEVGEDVLSKSFIGRDLNKIATDLGLLPEQEGKLAVRVEATMDHKVYSKAFEFTITPYEKSVVFGEIYMPGAYQNWNIETAAALAAIETGIYQGYVGIPENAGLGFKFNTARNWEQFYGDDGSGRLQNMSDTDFQMPGSGTFQVRVNLNTLTWNATPYSWGIIGDGTAGGWNTSSPMNYDHVSKTWNITTDLIVGGVKFRLNNAWTINYGSRNTTDGIVYLDDPGNHYISEAGTYKITFQINDLDPVNSGYPPTATYTITKI